jgi:site-specific recombinase XerD
MSALALPPPRPVTEQSIGAKLWNATLGWLLHQKSEHTRIAYQRGLLGVAANGSMAEMKAPAWLPWLQSRGLQPLDVTLAHVDLYGRQLAAAGLADRSQAARLAIVSSWYTHLIRVELTDKNPAALASRPNVDPDDSPAVSLSEDELNRLLDEAEADGPRTAALVAVLYFGALRIGSALGADLGDLGWEQGARTLTLRTKGGKVRRVVLEDQAHAALDAYLATRPGALPDEPLFATITGARLDGAYAWRLVRRLARRAGIESAGWLNSHALRHAHITHAFDEGVDGAVIQGTAGHRRFETTLGYDTRRKKRQRRSGTSLSDRRARYKAEREVPLETGN